MISWLIESSVIRCCSYCMRLCVNLQDIVLSSTYSVLVTEWGLVMKKYFELKSLQYVLFDHHQSPQTIPPLVYHLKQFASLPFVLHITYYQKCDWKFKLSCVITPECNLKILKLAQSFRKAAVNPGMFRCHHKTHKQINK